MPSITSSLMLALTLGAAVIATPIQSRQAEPIDVAFSGAGVLKVGWGETTYCIAENFRLGGYSQFGCQTFTATPIANTKTYNLKSAAGLCGVLADSSLSCGPSVVATAFSGTQVHGNDRQVHLISADFFVQQKTQSGQKFFATQQPGTDPIAVSWSPL